MLSSLSCQDAYEISISSRDSTDPIKARAVVILEGSLVQVGETLH
jgi:hypothetical protein